MVPRLDCSLSSLLCAEDNIISYDDDVYGDEFDDDVVLDDGVKETSEQTNNQMKNQESNDLPLMSEECFTMMVYKECEFLPASDYLMRIKNGEFDLEARMGAIDWIFKVQAYYNFGPVSVYLSTNYFDRFLSVYELPKGKEWTMALVAIACLSLAAKLEETDVPFNLQVVGSRYVFEAKSIQRMELLVLSTLKWRMQAVTPFSFIDYFLEKKISKSSIDKSMKLVLSTIRDIDFLLFKPSEIAAAVAISVVGETPTVENADLDHFVDKDKVMKCVELMRDSKEVDIVPSEPRSPSGVLDVGESSSRDSPIAKKRKINNPTHRPGPTQSRV